MQVEVKSETKSTKYVDPRHEPDAQLNRTSVPEQTLFLQVCRLQRPGPLGTHVVGGRRTGTRDQHVDDGCDSNMIPSRNHERRLPLGSLSEDDEMAVQ